jgi:dinuclear metal center YbgI/SA1388 family protein
MELLAPRQLAYDWDNVGLQLGDPRGTVEKILVTLDIDERVLHEAISAGADFIISHHPLIFRPLKALRTDLPVGRLIAAALAAGIRIYAAHTNLDIADGGVNDILAAQLGLTRVKVLQVTGHENLEKIVVFVPDGYENPVRDAMAEAGAGWIGNYSHCFFQAAGTGMFKPLEGSSPFLGEQGRLERVNEFKLETIIPSSLRSRVIKAMIKAHPYEDVAYDTYPLCNQGKPYGLGRIGEISSPCSLEQFCEFIKEKLKLEEVHVTGDLSRVIKKVAVCGGSGGDLVHEASFSGADVLVTGDLKYHNALDARTLDLAVIDAGHAATERVIVPALCAYLRQKIHESGFKCVVIHSAIETDPWKIK